MSAALPAGGAAEPFTEDERARLAPFFSNADRHVFVLTNLPETVKGALFARYSRSAKSLRRLFLDEFADKVGAEAGRAAPMPSGGTALERAERLYSRVFNEYGDDSVAQLGGGHIACEYASNVLTKLLERGRLMSYLEQSTRYVPYTDRLHGRWRYHVPAELAGGALREAYVRTLDAAFETYAAWIPRMQEYFTERHPRGSDSEAVHRAAIRAKALDTLRGLLPAATQSNVGIYGSGQAFESLLLRLRAHPLQEARDTADAMLRELRTIIPAFLVRVDQPDRGVRWSEYFIRTREDISRLSADVAGRLDPEPRDEVTLTDFDPEGEIKVAGAILYGSSSLPDDQAAAIARRMTAEERGRIIATYAGARTNRRHRPGRAFERTSYRFDVLADYGAFRDLQRHRLLTIEWQPLTTRHGYSEPAAVAAAGGSGDWQRCMDASAELYESLCASGLTDVAPYAASMAYRVRFCMDMNAREAMHVIELRSTPQGHPAYRRVCQRMHELIETVAGHGSIARAMRFVDHSQVELERLDAERALEGRRARQHADG